MSIFTHRFRVVHHNDDFMAWVIKHTQHIQEVGNDNHRVRIAKVYPHDATRASMSWKMVLPYMLAYFLLMTFVFWPLVFRAMDIEANWYSAERYQK